jgi:hypothetical protein
MTTNSRTVRTVGMISVAVVAIVAAVVSYAHMQDVAEMAGEGWRSWLEPLSVDGLLVGASLVLYVRRTSRFAWLAVTVGILVSLAANLAAAHPSLISRLVSAWPAIALALSYETLLTLVRPTSIHPPSAPIEPSPTGAGSEESPTDSANSTHSTIVDRTTVLNGHHLDHVQAGEHAEIDAEPVNSGFDPYPWARSAVKNGES